MPCLRCINLRRRHDFSKPSSQGWFWTLNGAYQVLTVRSWRNGRRAALRSLWGNTRGSSSLLDRTNYLKYIFVINALRGLPCSVPSISPSVGREYSRKGFVRFAVFFTPCSDYLALSALTVAVSIALNPSAAANAIAPPTINLAEDAYTAGWRATLVRVSGAH
jgi:hypothetical protein